MGDQALAAGFAVQPVDVLRGEQKVVAQLLLEAVLSLCRTR